MIFWMKFCNMGYGYRQKRSSLTGAVASVSAADFNKPTLSNVSQALTSKGCPESK